MAQVSQLVLSEYQKAHSLLWDELLFGARDLIPMESWRLRDDLDLEDFGGSWLSHPSNAEFLDGAELALSRRIQGSPKLQAMFLTMAAALSSQQFRIPRWRRARPVQTDPGESEAAGHVPDHGGRRRKCGLVSEGHEDLRGTCSGLPKAGAGACLYRTRPAPASIRVAVSDMAQYCMAAPHVDIGEAGHV
ncbi:hypothetical protein V491_02656, partial [Pseudogymnoascus sp. VKM F-3775]